MNANLKWSKGGVTVVVPALDIDAQCPPRSGARGALERRVVAALIQHLYGRGFRCTGVWDGEEFTPVHADPIEHVAIPKADVIDATKRAMEVVFNLDECSLRFAPFRTACPNREGRNEYADNEHGIYVVLGNDGWDSVSDWNYFDNDRDGFNLAMEAFDGEAFV